jgi:ABC-type transport system involved in multi-copper enzyme maturation permease subunit
MFHTALMPFLAILRYELRSLRASWLVRLWFIASLLLTLLWLAASWATVPTVILIAAMLSPYLIFPWFIPVMILGISPVTGSRLDALADGILSRPITRHEYLGACWAARVIIVLAVYLVVMAPAAALAALAQRPTAPDPVTLYGMVSALCLVGLVLTFLVTLGFLAGTYMRGPLVAAVVLIFGWFAINLFLHNFALEAFSSVSLNQALPTVLRKPWRTENAVAEQAVRQEDLETLSRTGDAFLSVLSGKRPAPAPKPPAPFFEKGHYEDFALWRVLLGYGVPTLLAFGLAAWCFSRRDL